MQEIVTEEISIREAIRQLDIVEEIKVLFVVNDKKELIGSMTDGDVRRWILQNGNLKDKVDKIMNKNPVFLHIQDKQYAKQVIKDTFVKALPIVDEQKRIMEIIFANNLFNNEIKLKGYISNPVVIMAGGKGTRLYPYTQILPKPLIPIGNLSITERIIQRFTKFGCNNFFMTVNYKKNMIKAYFDDLEKNYEVTYVEEEQFLGTAGSLSLLKEKITETFFVSNCDILVEADYIDILKYHKEKKNLITMVTSLKNYKIPYGVINLNDDGEVIGTTEKPEYDYLVNAGFYILEPETLSDIPKNTFFHITDLINKYINEGKRVGTYPITENAWLDMGEVKEMDRMIERLDL